MTAGNAFLRDILTGGNLDAAGAFADWLEEQGDARGVLLRRQYARWKAALAAADQTPLADLLRFIYDVGTLATAYGLRIGDVWEVDLLVRWKKKAADSSFRHYISRKFKKVV